VEVGDEHFLEHLFPERRFALWHVGEVQLVDHLIKPNARRDGFEHTPDHEMFLEQASQLARHLGSLCRKSSKERTQQRVIEQKLSATSNCLENISLAAQGLEKKRLIASARKNLASAENLIDRYKAGESFRKRTTALKAKVLETEETASPIADKLDGRKLSRKDSRELLIEVCSAITRTCVDQTAARKILAAAVGPYLKGDSSL
jgi:hypothetical protein